MAFCNRSRDRLSNKWTACKDFLSKRKMSYWKRLKKKIANSWRSNTNCKTTFVEFRVNWIRESVSWRDFRKARTRLSQKETRSWTNLTISSRKNSSWERTSLRLKLPWVRRRTNWISKCLRWAKWNKAWTIMKINIDQWERLTFKPKKQLRIKIKRFRS